MTGRRSSKSATKTTGRSFGRVVARVGVGLLLLLLVAEGAIVLPEEEKKGSLWLDRGSFSPVRRTTARHVVRADRAATAAAEEEEVVVTEDGFDGAGDHESSVMTQRKIAKGSKKNPSLLFHEEVRVSLVAPKEIAVPDLKAEVTKVVLEILNEERRGLVEFVDVDALRKKIYSFAVQIKGMTKKKCVENYSNDVLCHEATIMIKSKEDFKDRFLKFKDLLGKVLERDGFVLYPADNKGHYPYATIINRTPYDTIDDATEDSLIIKRNYVEYSHGCSDDEYSVAAGQTWSATSRGICRITSIEATLIVPVEGSYKRMYCERYYSGIGTSYGTFFIIMNGDNACCVQSSHESGVCDVDCGDVKRNCRLCPNNWDDDYHTDWSVDPDYIGSYCCLPSYSANVVLPVINHFCPGCASSF